MLLLSGGGAFADVGQLPAGRGKGQFWEDVWLPAPGSVC